MNRLFPIVLLALTGCDLLDIGQLCTTSVEPALLVEITDSTSLSPVHGRYPVIARSGAYADTADFSAYPTGQSDTLYWGPFPLAYERPGRYDLAIQAPTYRPWQRSGIQVTEGECHVHTVSVQARLRKQ